VALLGEENEKVDVSKTYTEEPETGNRTQEISGVRIPELSEKGKLKQKFVEYLKKDYCTKKEFGKLSPEDKVGKYVENGAIIGKDVYIGKDTYVIADYLKIGDGSRIEDSSLIESVNVEIGKMSRFGSGLRIDARIVKIGDLLWAFESITIGACGQNCLNSKVSIGNGCFIGPGAWINTTEPVVIGDRVAIGDRTYIYTHSHWLSVLDGYPVLYNPVVLEEHCWIGTNCMILPGVTIGKGTVVTVGSVVMSNLPASSLATGNPAKVVKDSSGFPVRLDKEAKDRIMNGIMERLYKFLEFSGMEVAKIGEFGNNGYGMEIGKKKLIYYRNHMELPGGSYQRMYLIGFTFDDKFSQTPENAVQFDLGKLEVRGERDGIYDEIREHMRRFGIKFDKPFLWRYGK
jgi:acetyltransferase-like isoleucine patch superfamily enzyme